MMAETDVTKEVLNVVEIDEKCGLDMNSYLDLPKSQCNGINHHSEANDLDDSYVIVTGTNGLSNDAVNNIDITAEDLSISSKSKADAINDLGVELDWQNEKSNAIGGEEIECNKDQPVINDGTCKQESFLEDGDMAKNSVADSVEKPVGEIGTLTEAEVKQVEDPGGKAERLEELEKVGFQSGTIEGEQEKLNNFIKSESIPVPVWNQESEASVNDFSAISSGEETDDVIVACRKQSLDSFNINEEGALNTVETKDLEDRSDQLDCSAGSSNENLFLQETEESGNCHSSNISVVSQEGSSANMINGEEESIKTKTKPFNFLSRVPRFDDENLTEQIRLAKLHADEMTKVRDAIHVQIQEIRANCQIHGIDYEYAKSESRGAQKLVRSKRTEIDSLQSVINKAKNALSVEEIDSKIHNMEHMIQHETLQLKEEKHLIREIKQLKQLREQLSSNMGSQDEIKQALERREEVEERLKVLRKELDILKDRVLKTEAVAMEAGKRYDLENKKLKELLVQFRAANDVRQAAYAQWQSLRKEFTKKNQHFFKYKDDSAVASNYAFSRDTEALYHLCTNQVYKFMELWNTSDKFRIEYVKFNAKSTLRRFGTLDGRSLGPDEVPPILPTSYVSDRANRMGSTPVTADLRSQVPLLDLKQETYVENVEVDEKSTMEMAEHGNQKVKKKRRATIQVDVLDAVSSWNNADEEPKKSKEEIEAIRKAEKLRKEADAELKEQRRLEELAKAKEARERKKRQAEKLQKREELKAQKEAEEKEKEKERRLRKKERKKAGTTDANDIKSNREPPPSSSVDEISKDTSNVKAKKAQKTWFTKQNKTKSVPPPLRYRNKKKWQQWLWVAMTSLVIFALFWLGNICVFSNIDFRRRSPIH